MTSKDKTENRAPREGTLGPLLDRLKPGEAATVFRRLLKAHPDLSSEADEIARSLLRQLEYEDVAAEIEDEIRALDYEDLNARAGSHEWGYVEPSEAAWEILEETVEPVLDDMKRHIELGLRVATFWDGHRTSPLRRLEMPWNSGMLEPACRRVARSVKKRVLRFLRIS